jgi:hypothetical protein
VQISEQEVEQATGVAPVKRIANQAMITTTTAAIERKTSRM